MRKYGSPWILWFATAVHLMWGVGMLVSNYPLVTTPTADILAFLPQMWAGALFLVVAAFALWELLSARKNGKHILWLAPQQALLVLSAVGAVGSVLSGAYPDGVVRPSTFILVDQAPTILVAVFHAFALIDRYGRGDSE